MKFQVKDFADLCGVSVRTLHYYDEIGLLKPNFIEKNGYRFYDLQSLERMQEILFYRELDFPLKNILEILSSPNYDKKKALSEQKKLLTIKKNRLEKLISAIDDMEKGNYSMNLEIFDNSEFENERKKYSVEAQEKWGETSAYKEHQKKTSSYSSEKWGQIDKEMSFIFSEFAECVKNNLQPENEKAQNLVQKWQNFITENMYTCTKEILAGLGEMYSADERFKNNIDKSGEGTAEFMTKAIHIFCKK